MGKEVESKNALLFWSISPVHWVVRILGLAPYSVVVEKEKTHYRPTMFSLFYNVFVISVLFLSLIPVVQFQKSKLESKNLDKISVYSDLYDATNGFVISIASTLCALISRHEVCRLFDEMSDFDEDLGYLGVKVNYKGQFRKYLIGVAITYVSLLLCFISDFFTFFLGWHLTFLYWAAIISFTLVNFSTFVNFVGYVYMIIARLQILNYYILRLSKTVVTRPLPRSNLWMTKSSLDTASSTFKQSNKSLADHRKSTTTAKYDYDNPLNTLCELHNRLCEWSKRLNAIYSIQILLMTGMAFVVLVIQLYSFYLMLSKNELYPLTLQKAWSFAVWGIMFFLVIFIISFFCSKTKDMADESVLLLHQINLDLRDDETRISVEMFCLQMYHQRIEFTACGFFPVDFSVLYMIMGAVTTYLVFLVQFEIASRSAAKLT